MERNSYYFTGELALTTIKELETRVKQLEDRNKKIEGNKAWEISFSRKVVLIMFTYLAIGIYMYAVNLPDPWLNAIVPAVAFMLSTLTLPFFRRIWLRYLHKK